MSKPLCVHCTEKPASQGDYCADCLRVVPDIIAAIEADPSLKVAFVQARDELQHQYQTEDRQRVTFEEPETIEREAVHVDAPTSGTIQHFLLTREALSAMPREKQALFTRLEWLALETHFMLTYKAEVGDIGGKFPEQPTGEDHASLFNQIGQDAGWTDRSIGKSRVRFLLKSAKRKLAVIGYKL